MNRNGPPVELDCHRFDDAAVCCGRQDPVLRKLGSAEMLGKRSLAGKLAAVRVSINTSVADPINRFAEIPARNPGRVRANHYQGSGSGHR